MLVDFTGLYRVLLNITGFYCLELGFPEFSWVFTEFQFVLLGFTRFDRVFLDFTGFYCL